MILSFFTLQRLDNVPASTCNVARFSHNISLNRFKNIYPCKNSITQQVLCMIVCVCVCVWSDDDTRVVLTEIPGVMGSDYINASFITVRTYSLSCVILKQYFFLRDIMGTITLQLKVICWITVLYHTCSIE